MQYKTTAILPMIKMMITIMMGKNKFFIARTVNVVQDYNNDGEGLNPEQNSNQLEKTPMPLQIAYQD